MSTTFEISEEQRKTVRAMAGFGMPLRDIADYLETTPEALQRHMGKDIAKAALEANAKVAQALFAMATQDRNVVAAIFWLKARALWRDRPPPEDDQVVSQPRSVIVAPSPSASTEEWLARHAPPHARGTIVINTGVPRSADGPVTR